MLSWLFYFLIFQKYSFLQWCHYVVSFFLKMSAYWCHLTWILISWHCLQFVFFLNRFSASSQLLRNYTWDNNRLKTFIKGIWYFRYIPWHMKETQQATFSKKCLLLVLLFNMYFNQLYSVCFLSEQILSHSSVTQELHLR